MRWLTGRRSPRLECYRASGPFHTPNKWNFLTTVGRTPGSARVPLDPLFAGSIWFLYHPPGRRGRRPRTRGSAPPLFVRTLTNRRRVYYQNQVLRRAILSDSDKLSQPCTLPSAPPQIGRAHVETPRTE